MDGLDNGGKRTGAMLAAARAAAGLELSDVARETRVPLRHLKALEIDRHDDLPALPYAIGFVKAYARAVGLEPETVAAQFRGETSKGVHVPTPLTLEPLDERRLPSRALVVGSVAAVVGIIALLSAWGSGSFDPVPVAPTLVAAAPEAAPVPAVADPAAAMPVTAGPGTAAPAIPGAAPIAAAGAVVLTAREDVWVKIYDRTSKASTKIGVLAAGERYAVPTDPPGLLLWTGKAGALDVSVGGRALPPLGGPVETVRDVSLAAADLVARANGATPPGAAASDGPKPIATIPRPRPVVPAPATVPAAAPATQAGV